MSEDQHMLINLTADIVSAHVGNNAVAVSDVPNLITQVHSALANLDSAASRTPAAKQDPAVSIRASVKPDYIVCLEDGRKMKTLKRHLLNAFGLTPEAYRAKWDLPKDYPMVAPNYAKMRAEMAKTIGLGRKQGTRVKKK